MIVDMGCTQTMVKTYLISAQAGEPKTPVNVVGIHRISYMYENRRLWLTVMGHTEELAVGLVDTLPCPTLLGIDW